MYIPPFVCGIAFTLIAELAIGIVYAIVSDRKEGDDDAESGD